MLHAGTYAYTMQTSPGYSVVMCSRVSSEFGCKLVKGSTSVKFSD